MKHFITICNLLLLMLSCQLIYGQARHNYHSITGIVTDSISGKPVDYVTVSLSDTVNKPFITTMTKTNGMFTFSHIGTSTYILHMVCVGYKTKNIILNPVGNANGQINLGVILLADQQNNLKEVTVSSSRQIIKQKADRIIYDLQADPESRGSSVLDMMRKVPYISVDANDNILLKGNSSFKVFINGKPSPMLENNLKDILRSMPASTIQSIEVITIPPSKYDAEGLAGIINIITNKKIDNGYKGNLNINENAPAGGPGGGGSFTFKAGKFGISAYGGSNVYNSPQTSNINARTAYGDNASYLIQNGGSNNNSGNNYFGTQLSYEIDTLHLISADLNAYNNNWNSSSFQASRLTADTGLLQAYNLNNAGNGSGGGFDADINYQLGFKKDKNQLLTFSYRYSQYSSDSHNNISLFDEINFPTPGYRQYNYQWASEQTAQVDYVKPVKQLTIETGIKAIFRDNKSNSSYSSRDSLDNGYTLVPALSDNYTNTQDIYSAYNSYGISLKSWDIHGGLRLEQTVTRADFISDATHVNQNYLNLVPAIAVNKTFAGNSSLSFGFSERIKRPSIGRLNPYIDRSDPDVESSGNPYLKPNTINELQAAYSLNKKISLNVALAYDFMNNLDLQVATFDPVTKITSFTYQNVGWVSGLSNNININYPVTKQYSISLNSYIMYLTLSGTVNGVLLQNTHLLTAANLSNSFNMDNGWRLNADLDITSKSPTSLQGTTNSVIATSFGVNKELIKNRLNFSAGIKNPFTKFRNNTAYTYGTSFNQYAANQQYFRSFNLSLNYNFGKLKQGVQKSRKQIRNDDTSGGGI